jgi:hypothetical protein
MDMIEELFLRMCKVIKYLYLRLQSIYLFYEKKFYYFLCGDHSRGLWM